MSPTLLMSMPDNQLSASANTNQMLTKIMKTKLFISILLSFMSLNLLAETLYVDDKIKIWSRTGASNDYNLKYQYAPGEKLEVIKKNSQSDFVEIKDQSGRTAFIDSKYLTATPTVHQAIITANIEIESLKNETAKQASLLDKTSKQLEPLELLNQQLQNKLARQENELEQLRQKSKVYENGFNSEVAITGSIIILAGMFIGWLLSKLGGRKRHSGWS